MTGELVALQLVTVIATLPVVVSSGACTLICPVEIYETYAGFPLTLTLTPSSDVGAFDPLKSAVVH
jgi:hypothetical protein